MINLTNNQVIAFNKLNLLKQTLLTRIISKISTNTISIILIHYQHSEKYIWIRKSTIEVKSYRIVDKSKIYDTNNRKLIRSYSYKLKKR